MTSGWIFTLVCALAFAGWVGWMFYSEHRKRRLAGPPVHTNALGDRRMDYAAWIREGGKGSAEGPGGT